MNKSILFLLAVTNSAFLFAGDFFACPPAPAPTPVPSPYLRSHSAPLLRSQSAPAGLRSPSRPLSPSLVNALPDVKMLHIAQEYMRLKEEFQKQQAQKGANAVALLASLKDIEQEIQTQRDTAKKLNITTYDNRFRELARAVNAFINSLFSPSAQRRLVEHK